MFELTAAGLVLAALAQLGAVGEFWRGVVWRQFGAALEMPENAARAAWARPNSVRARTRPRVILRGADLAPL